MVTLPIRIPRSRMLIDPQLLSAAIDRLVGVECQLEKRLLALRINADDIADRAIARNNLIADTKFADCAPTERRCNGCIIAVGFSGAISGYKQAFPMNRPRLEMLHMALVVVPA